LNPVNIVRPRLFASLAFGVLVMLVLPSQHVLVTRVLLAWDAACLLLAALSAQLFTIRTPAEMPADAERQEEGEWTLFWVTVVGLIASFAAILSEFALLKDLPEPTKSFHVALVAATLFLSWLATHTLFAYRYAHEYYEVDDATGKIIGGLQFPEDSDPDYWDFFYFSLVLGMTFQVSDVQITRRSLRRLAAAHGLLGFLFNTVILALTVNIGASLL
jgi:uncharacterized membrane protein